MQMNKQPKKQVEIPSMEQVAAERERLRQGNQFRRTMSSTIAVLVVVAAVAILVATLWMPVLQIYGSSMTPTLDDGEIIVLRKTSDLEAGDIIAFYYNNKILVKRVIGGAGDWIDIDSEGSVSLNGQLLHEPYITDKSLGECDLEFPYQVPDEAFFVMGDHRSVSVDSRSSTIGCIRQELILGKVALRVWPLHKLLWVP